MGHFRTALVTASLVLGAASAFAKTAEPPLVMTPASGWVVDYADESCALRRAFVAGDETAILEMRQYGPGDQLEIALVSETLARPRRAPRVRFEPDTEWLSPTSALFVNAGTLHGILYNDDLRPEAMRPPDQPWTAWPEQDRDAREQGITGITIADSFGRDITLHTGKLHAPMDAMRACTQELTTHWGLEPAVPGPLARGASPTGLSQWARKVQEDYPSEMVRAGKSGRVPVRMIIGKDGRPTSCQAVGLAEQSFVEAACSSMMRYARFNPALDGNGEPTTGSYTTTIIYQTW